MRELHFDLRRLQKDDRQGSHGSRRARGYVLAQAVETLHQLGDRGLQAKGLKGRHIEAWRAGIARLSRSWAQPVLSALDSGAVARVMIRDERGNRFTATCRRRFRLWRRDGLAARIAAQSGQVR